MTSMYMHKYKEFMRFASTIHKKNMGRTIGGNILRYISFPVVSGVKQKV